MPAPSPAPDADATRLNPAVVETETVEDEEEPKKSRRVPIIIGILAGGKQDVNAAEQKVMPAFGDNKNVMCYVDDLWTYLRARGSGELPRGRPAKRADKSEAYSEAEKACMDG